MSDENNYDGDDYADEFAEAAAKGDFKKAKEMGIKWALLSNGDAKDSANRSAAMVNILKAVNMKADNEGNDDGGVRGFLKRRRLTREEVLSVGIPLPPAPNEGSVFVTRTLAPTQELAPKGDMPLESFPAEDEPEPAIEAADGPTVVATRAEQLSAVAAAKPDADKAIVERYMAFRREGRSHPVALTLSKVPRRLDWFCKNYWETQSTEAAKA